MKNPFSNIIFVSFFDLIRHKKFISLLASWLFKLSVLRMDLNEFKTKCALYVILVMGLLPKVMPTQQWTSRPLSIVPLYSFVEITGMQSPPQHQSNTEEMA